jgi:CheY-like chemotaxis protein
MARILIADDDPDLRESLRLLLELQGHTVDEASNGADALRHLDPAQPPCVILLDLMMPVMDGWQFRREQLQNPALADIPVLVISAIPAHMQRTGELGARRVFPKPFDYDDLLTEVATICPGTPHIHPGRDGAPRRHAREEAREDENK